MADPVKVDDPKPETPPVADMPDSNDDVVDTPNIEDLQKEHADKERKLKDENAKRRIDNRDLKNAAVEKDAEIAKLHKMVKAAGIDLGADPEEAVSKMNSQLEASNENMKKLIAENSFLAEAAKKGIADPALAFRLIDFEKDGISIDIESREVAGMSDAVDKLIERAPYLLGTPSQSTPPQSDVSGPGTPTPTQPGPEDKKKFEQELKEAYDRGGGTKEAQVILAKMRENK